MPKGKQKQKQKLPMSAVRQIVQNKGSYVAANGVPIGTRGKGSFVDWFKYVPRGIGAAAGLANGGLSGATKGWKVGEELSKTLGLGKYKGKGAYVPNTGSNIVYASPVPFMHSGDESVNLTKIEYLGDLFTSSVAGSFALTSIPFNPGVMLYWGSKFAGLFQQWKLNGAMVYFRSRSSSYASATALGTVMICMNYNAHAPSFASKQEMQETAGCVSCAIDQNASCAIEAKNSMTLSPVKYVRLGNLPSGEDSHLYDLGNLQIATVGCPTASANVGELYIAYDITFMKPVNKIGATVEGARFNGVQKSASDLVTTVAPTTYWNTYGITLSEAPGPYGIKVNFPAGTAGKFLFHFIGYGDVASTFGFNCPTISNMTAWSSPSLFGGSSHWAPQGAETSIRFEGVLQLSITNPSLSAYCVINPTRGDYTNVNWSLTINEFPATALSAPVPEQCLNRFPDLVKNLVDEPQPKNVVDDEKEKDVVTIQTPFNNCTASASAVLVSPNPKLNRR